MSYLISHTTIVFDLPSLIALIALVAVLAFFLLKVLKGAKQERELENQIAELANENTAENPNDGGAAAS